MYFFACFVCLRLCWPGTNTKNLWCIRVVKSWMRASPGPSPSLFCQISSFSCSFSKIWPNNRLAPLQVGISSKIHTVPEGYSEHDWLNRNQVFLMPVTVSDKSENFCTIYGNPLIPFPILVKRPGRETLNLCSYLRWPSFYDLFLQDGGGGGGGHGPLAPTLDPLLSLSLSYCRVV